MWRGQHAFETFAMEDDDACKMKKVENEASPDDDESADEDRTESKTQAITTLNTWKPPFVETQSTLQLHLDDDCRRRCEQGIRLGIRGSINRLREHQPTREST